MHKPGSLNIPSFIKELRFSFDSLSDFAGVISEKELEDHQNAIRKKHLSSSVKVVPELFPKLFQQVSALQNRLSPNYPLDVYVYNSPEIQAACCSGLSDKFALILVSSSLIQLLSMDELLFVIGHELGHHFMNHHYTPVDDSGLEGTELLNLLALRRAQEISADRVGFLACSSRGTAFKAILKSASGLPDSFIRFDINAFLDQAREISRLGGSEYESYSSHPMFAVRLRALLWFEMSKPYFKWLQKEEKARLSKDDLDKKVERDLANVSGFRILEMNEFTINSATLWGVLAVFTADNLLSKSEQLLLKRTFDKKTAEKAIDYVKENGPKAVMSKLEIMLRKAKLLPKEKKIMLYETLERFAGDAGGSEDHRLRVLRLIAERLGLEREAKIRFRSEVDTETDKP